MKRNRIKLRFERPTRFDVTPTGGPPFRGTLETELDRLKDRLLLETLEKASNADLYAPLRRAANDAAALAWTTQFPLLVFPALLEEKTREARRQYDYQQQVLKRSSRMVNAA